MGVIELVIDGIYYACCCLLYFACLLLRRSRNVCLWGVGRVSGTFDCACRECKGGGSIRE